MCAKGYLDSKGELVQFTHLSKNVYCYVLSRFEHFKKNDKPYFESNANIARVLGSSPAVIGRIMDGFRQTGVLVGEKKNTGKAGQHAWVYHKIKDFRDESLVLLQDVEYDGDNITYKSVDDVIDDFNLF